MVEDVEEVGASLKRKALVKLELPAQRQIDLAPRRIVRLNGPSAAFVPCARGVGKGQSGFAQQRLMKQSLYVCLVGHAF